MPELWSRQELLGDGAGVRPWLARFGVALHASETSEILANGSGGLRTGPAYDGVTILALQVDPEPALGWRGGSFTASALQIHGRNLSTDTLSTLQTASGIEAERATRLWELWVQQSCLADRLDLRIGQQSIDLEFLFSQGSSLFINTAMGWPLVPSIDLYAGGPTYPLSSLGARLRARSIGPVTALAGVFDDNPPGGPFADDRQSRGAEASGTLFNTAGGALVIAEFQVALDPPPANDGAGQTDSGLPGSYRLGGWYDTARFPDQRFDTAGRSLADPASAGAPKLRGGNYGLYGVVDQAVWRPSTASPPTLSVFVRLVGAPEDRNLASFSLNAGVTLKGPSADRADDTAGFGFGVAQVSGAAAALDRDVGRFSRAPARARSTETFLEATYQMVIAPWWQVQPDIQYVFNPGGGVANPLRPAAKLGDEAVFGLRTNINF